MLQKEVNELIEKIDNEIDNINGEIVELNGYECDLKALYENMDIELEEKSEKAPLAAFAGFSFAAILVPSIIAKLVLVAGASFSMIKLIKNARYNVEAEQEEIRRRDIYKGMKNLAKTKAELGETRNDLINQKYELKEKANNFNTL